MRSTVRPSISKARGVAPMCVLEDHQHRVMLDSASSCAVSASSVFLGVAAASVQALDSVHRSEATTSRQRGRVLTGRKVLRKHGVELVEFCLPGVS